MAIPASFKDELIARSDILDIVSDYVTLTPKGGSYWGLCPFHGEKTPSFHVLPDRQLYHCFGCGKGGGVISFIMDVENLPFLDAMRLLAKRAGMEFPEGEMDEGNRRNLMQMAATVEEGRKIVMMGKYIRRYPHYDYVPDPYYEGAEGFELVLDLLEDACDALLSDILQKENQ